MNIERAPEPAPDDKEAALASWHARREEQATAETVSENAPGTSDKDSLGVRISRLARERDKANRAMGYIPSRNRPNYGGDSLESSRRAEKAGIGLAALAGALAVVAALTGPSMTDASYGAEKATVFLERSGYTNVEHESTDLFLIGNRGCGRDDSVRYDFDATAPDGTKNVDIIVCKGFWNGAIVREANHPVTGA